MGTVVYIDVLVQDCSNSIANTLELLQSSTESSIVSWCMWTLFSFPCMGYWNSDVIPLPVEMEMNLTWIIISMAGLVQDCSNSSASRQ